MKFMKLLAASVVGITVGLSGIGNAAAECQPEDTGFHVKAGAVYMTREKDTNQTLAIETGTGATLLESKSMEPGWEPGLDVAMDYKGESFTAELRYMGLLDWSEDSPDAASTTGAITFLHPATITGFAATPVTQGRYESSLDSAELNIGWRPLDFLTVFVGPRWIAIDEDMTAELALPGLDFKDKISVSNKLLGGQVGVKGVVFNSDFGSADVTGKVGYFNNEMSAQMSTTPVVFTARDFSEKETLVAEGAVNMSIAIIKHLSLSLGYQALWLQNVSTSAQAFGGANALNGRINQPTQDLIYHGGRASLVYSF